MRRLFANVCPNLPDVQIYPTLPYYLNALKKTHASHPKMKFHFIFSLQKTDLFLYERVTRPAFENANIELLQWSYTNARIVCAKGP